MTRRPRRPEQRSRTRSPSSRAGSAPRAKRSRGSRAPAAGATEGSRGRVTSPQARPYTRPQCTTPHVDTLDQRAIPWSTKRSPTSARARLAFCDDREIALRQQNRAFFQISGAGHEALLLGLARHLRAGYDWFFPYYRDRLLALALGVTPTEMLMQAVGAADDPASGGRQMPCHWGSARLNIVTPDVGHRAASACPPSGARRPRATSGAARSFPGCTAHGDELTYVSLGEGATSEGEFWESLNTASRLHLPVLFVVADNGYAISVRSTDQHPAPISEMVRGIRGLHVVKMDGRDYFEVRRKGANAIAHVRAGAGPCLIHALVTRRIRTRCRTTRRSTASPKSSADEREHDPITVLEQQLIAEGVLTTEAAAERVEATGDGARGRGRGRLQRPSPESVVDHVVGAMPVLVDPGDPPDARAGPPLVAKHPRTGVRISMPVRTRIAGSRFFRIVRLAVTSRRSRHSRRLLSVSAPFRAVQLWTLIAVRAEYAIAPIVIILSQSWPDYEG